MKISISYFLKVIVTGLLIAFTISTNEGKILEVEGSSTNYGGKSVEAVKSALAKTNNKDIILTNDPRYKIPALTNKLPLREPIRGGPAEAAEEVPSVYDYYDGANGIKHSVTFCQQFITKPQACVNQGSCGWCMGEGTCVNGSANGPVNNKDCLRGKYVFEAPNSDWNPISIPNTRLSRTNVLGAQLTTIVQQP